MPMTELESGRSLSNFTTTSPFLNYKHSCLVCFNNCPGKLPFLTIEASYWAAEIEILLVANPKSSIYRPLSGFKKACSDVLQSSRVKWIRDSLWSFKGHTLVGELYCIKPHMILRKSLDDQHYGPSHQTIYCVHDSLLVSRHKKPSWSGWDWHPK